MSASSEELLSSVFHRQSFLTIMKEKHEDFSDICGISAGLFDVILGLLEKSLADCQILNREEKLNTFDKV
jgi:hypothetical protein